MKSRKAARAPATKAGAARVPVLEIDEEHEHGARAKPISLHPLDFATAMKGLLAVKWPAEKDRKPRKGRRASRPS